MSLRGSRTLFTDIFITETDAPVRHRKGRSDVLITKRNECIVHRYYFIRRQTKWDYQTLVESVAEQFFLSPATIADIIGDNGRDLHLLKKEFENDETLVRLKKRCSQKWPHFVW